MAVLLGGVSAAAAQGTWDGYVAGAGGWTSTTRSSDPAQSGTIWQGRGTIAAQSAGIWGAQADVVYTYQTLGSDPGGTEGTTDVAAHVFARQPGQWLFGGIAQYRNDAMNTYGSQSSTQYFIGGEAQGIWGAFSLYGQLAWQQINQEYGNSSGPVLNVRGRYFFNPQWYGEATATVGQVNQEYGSTTLTALGLGTEYQFNAMPLSLFARYAHIESTPDKGSNSQTTDRVLLGAKWNFGSKTLWDRETSGAALDPFMPITVSRPPI